MAEELTASIIVSSYNYACYLRQAVDSALNQTRSAEVIVVDDGSTDPSREILAEYAGQVITVLQKNSGQASAWNSGFSRSSGDIIFFLDSDDALLPNAVEAVIGAVDRPGIAKVHWPLREIDSQGRDTGGFIPEDPLSDGDLREALIESGTNGYVWPPTSGNAWSRSFAESVFPMPEPEYTTCPDLYLSALAPLFGYVRRIDEPLALLRTHARNHGARGRLANRIATEIMREDRGFADAQRWCREMGRDLDFDTWKAASWRRFLQQTLEAINAVVPPEGTFILIDDEWLRAQDLGDRRATPFLERNGEYWGPPSDDASAISEFEQLRGAGASFIVFLSPAFWWLEYYADFNRYLRCHFPCAQENECLVAFDLRPRTEGLM